MNKCISLKLNGKRCQREALFNKLYCTMHFKKLLPKNASELEWDRIKRNIRYKRDRA